MSRSALRPLLALLLVAPTLRALPPGFTDSLVTSLGSPTSIAFTPDGRMLLTRQTGSLRVYQAGALLPTPALTFSSTNICTDFERGLLGVTVDPAFATNNFIYLYYTYNRFHNACPYNSASSPANRVSRFVLPAGNVIDPLTETVLVDNMPSPNGNHNAGDVQFGKDEYLYITIGDGGCDYAGGGCGGSNDGSRDQFTLTGKVLRITRDGNIPPDNPFQGAGTARCNVTGGTTPGNRCQETFAWGLRNPFRLAFDPNAAGTRFFINDVGQNVYEEIDLGQAGTDYGWNCREAAHTNSSSGACNPTPSGMVDPVFEYTHNQTVPGTSVTGCNSITGGAFVPNGLWPGYDGVYLFSDYVCGAIFQLRQSGAVFSASDFASGLGSSSAVHMIFGPDGASQALYYTNFAGGGQIRKITYTAPANRAPTAVATATPNAGPVPLDVSFDASASTDPDPGDTLTYAFTFGDGSPVFNTSNPIVPHTYATAGPVNATLVVTDNHGLASTPLTIPIAAGNGLPNPTILTPASGATFTVGQNVSLTGSATDPEDGTLPASSLSWTVLQHHDTHTHPRLGPIAGNNINLVCPAPEDLLAATNSYLEVRLTATDSGAQTRTVTRNFLPQTVNLTLATIPPGLGLTLNDTALTGPQTVQSWVGWTVSVNAPHQTLSGTSYRFQSWSDAGAQAHDVTSPASPVTVTATFVACPTIAVSPVSVPNAFANLPYPTQTLGAGAGTAPFTFARTSGALPP